MIEGEEETGIVTLGAPKGPDARLPYTVELWNLPRTAAERVIGRASSMVLARAIFSAAGVEHLGRRVVLRRGTQVLAESG